MQLHPVAKRVTAEIVIWKRPCGVPNAIVVLVLRAVRPGDVRFNSKSGADLRVGIRMEGEVSSENQHLELLSAEIAKYKAVSIITAESAAN